MRSGQTHAQSGIVRPRRVHALHRTIRSEPPISPSRSYVALGKFPSQKENPARRRSRQSSPAPFELRLWLSASSAQARARSKRNLKQYRGPMATPEPKPALVCSPAMTTVRLQRNRPSLVSLTASNRPPLLHLPGASFDRKGVLQRKR
jgi:hypothetical protein